MNHKTAQLQIVPIGPIDDKIFKMHPITGRIGQKIAYVVTSLRNERWIVSKPISDMMDLFSSVMMKRVIPAFLLPMDDIAYSYGEPTVSFDWRDEKPSITIPTGWETVYAKNEAFHVGALIWTASQVMDWFNKRHDHLDDQEYAKKKKLPLKMIPLIRASGYESEFIRRYAIKNPKWQPTDDQKDRLKEMPRGVDSIPRELRYISRKFEECRAV